MTQKVLEIDVMVYNMTKNPKIYKKIFLVNCGIQNQQILKITNVEKQENGEQLNSFVKYQRISLDFLNINRNKYKI